jgi:nucleotide-binding universal stress UspA family protein
MLARGDWIGDGRHATLGSDAADAHHQMEEEQIMKVLIAHDPLSREPLPLADLRRAGFPPDCHVCVLTIADVLVPPTPEGIAADQATVPAHVQIALDQARQGATTAQAELRAEFPGWTIEVDTIADAPAWGIVRKADAWQADLILVGAHRNSALSRLVLGSVSGKVLHEASASVRIVRRGTIDTFKEPRLLIGIDGSAHAEAAASAVTARQWPRGTLVRVITINSAADREADPTATPPGERLDRVARPLADRGLTVSVGVVDGDPKDALLSEAEAFHADCIFLGARGLRLVERIVLGSVSAAVATRAPCSVEIVRVRS